MLAQMPESGNPQDVREIHQLQRCFYCRAPIYWMRHRITGRYAAIDLGQTHEGNIMINLTRGTYEEMSADDRAIYQGWMHARHARICPDVDKWLGRGE